MEQPRHARFHVFGTIVRLVSVLAIIGFAAWGGMALFYQAPGPSPVRMLIAALWVILSLVALYTYVRWRSRTAALVYPVMIAALLFWWNAIPASNNRDWADEVAHIVAGVVNGHEVTLANVRNFDWRTSTDYTVRWENRTYDLDKLASVDLLLSYWSSPAIAHTLISFGFDDGQFVTFSVEIRKEQHESFSEVGGFFKEFETSVIAADERDIVRVRTNIRKEDVYLYRLNMPKPRMRSLFLSYLDEANGLNETPQYYNTITANCTTIVFAMVNRIASGSLPLDYRLIFSGYLPSYIIDVKGFTPGFTLEQLRGGGAITTRAQAADEAQDFSRRIREGVPGIAPLTQP
ncbi:DUF4105 domain-containing protein [Pararhizobium sp. BT-229]|uniref:Lnb N-terminal periplasmic domain-containing protein n=1 Tax=Pararhizobium sp. BT-229 TaxID=2986923 RepID=UPI0021F7E5DF|nr:DUF4105 domain-containing protein [Pararhizobium sp. BT-229]MCV9961445.1 DUF4105 domain-containing protein [Pararhizobium sp. BT-229]